jgi:starvation-inducible DNA-binding protein
MNKSNIDDALDEALMQTFPASDPFHITSESTTAEVRTMHRTKDDLPEATRKKIIDLLQARLADVIDLITQTKQAHWNVKGSNFIALHELFDRIHGEVEEYGDTFAERLVALGGQAYGTVREASRRSSLSEYPVEIVSSEEHVNALSSALAEFGKTVRAAIEAAAELGDQDTSDLFTEVSRGIDKSLWLVEAYSES